MIKDRSNQGEIAEKVMQEAVKEATEKQLNSPLKQKKTVHNGRS